MNNQVDEAVKIFNQGGIVIFPTDTAFGIGCRIDNEKAIKKLFKIRNRPAIQPAPILVNGLEMIKEYVIEVSTGVTQKLINPFWPGALTIVLKANTANIPSLVRGGGGTIGIRMPNNPIALAIIEKIGVPILGPSANFHGEETPYEFKALNKELISLVDYIVEGECKGKKASTVIDCIKTPWQILRQGEIDIKI
jgi:L-threonylcarbamoyladenylate synthase